jgi:hypothetical protein
MPARRSSGVDVPDAHLGTARDHRVVHREIERAVAMIVGALDAGRAR